MKGSNSTLELDYRLGTLEPRSMIFTLKLLFQKDATIMKSMKTEGRET